MARCIAEPLSRKDIRKTAELIRKIDGSENDMFFDIVRFLEIKLPVSYTHLTLPTNSRV